MKIALIRRTYITHIDGVNRTIALLADAFMKLGHDVTIFSWSYRDVKREELSRWLKELHGIDTELKVETLRNPVKSDSWLKIALDWWLKGSRMLKGFDVAIVNGIIPLRFKPVVAVNHGIIETNWLYRKVAARLYSMSDKVVCVSRKLGEELKQLGIRCDVFIPPPLKLDLYRLSSDREDIVVHIGGRPIKNPEVSAKAIEILNKKGFHVKLYIIGKEGRDTDYVKWLGNIDEKTRINILCRAKALIHPSSYEAFPLAVAEAMACGTPPVVSPAVSEELAIDGYNAIRVTTYNPEGYAEALYRLLTNNDLWNRISQNGILTARELDHIKIAQKYVSILKSVIATHHG